MDEPIAIRALKRYAADNEGAGSTGQRAARPLVACLWRPGSGRCRRRPRGTFVRLLPRAAGTAFGGLRGAAAGGRNAGRRHPGIPAAQDELEGGHRFHPLPRSRASDDARVGSVEELCRQGFRAVFLGTGAHRNRALRIPGEDLPGVAGSLEFLRGLALANAACGQRVAVIGGGNAAVDTARSALRMGAKAVTLLLSTHAGRDAGIP